MEKVEIPSHVIVEKTKIADPAGLGLAGFALTTYVLSAHNCGWAQDLSWLGLAFFYGGLAQFLAGMWEFSRNNAFGATAFSTYGSFWMSLGLLVVLRLAGVIPNPFNLAEALGWFISGFFIFNLYMLTSATLTNMAVLAVFFFLTFTELCLFVGYFILKDNALSSHGANWIKAGGYFGIFTAAAAFYTSFASVFNSLANRTIVPVGGPLLNFAKE